MSTLAVNTITNAAGGNTAQINGMTPTGDSLQGFRNRIINGDMRIDQRNAGASVTPTSGVYTLDRWQFQLSAAGKFSVQRSTSAPAGFNNSLIVTSLGAYSVTSSDFFTAQYNIEGFNFADFNWGSADAKAVTLSFWVQSSLTGTFTGSFRNAAGSRAYPYAYTINTANAWQFITITVPGDTTGTWVGSTNGTGVQIFFDFGSGSANQGTPGAWANGSFNAATGQTNLLATNGATWQVTGVQLEAGAVATPFERRPFGAELALCQRYFISYGGGNAFETIALGYGTTTTNAIGKTFLPVEMRALPTATITASGTLGFFDGISIVPVTAITVDQPSLKIFNANFTAASGLTAHRPVGIIANSNINARMLLSAEL